MRSSNATVALDKSFSVSTSLGMISILVWAFMVITWFMLIMHVVKETRILLTL